VPDRLVACAGRGRRGAQEIALGQDADDLAVLRHHDGAGIGPLHHLRRRSQAVSGRAGHGGRGHEVAHDRVHVCHYAPLHRVL
jgi:hypothetical protein